MGKSEKEILEKTYEKPGAVWTSSKPPVELVELIESGKVKPCKCLDIGCGEGFYSIYLASKGFDVTAIDLSENAIKYAKQNARDAGVDVKFIAMDVTDLNKICEKFDFVLEWALLHLIMPEEREAYVGMVCNLLNENGKYFSVCFNERDGKFGGGKGLRMIPKKAKAIVGAKIYFASIEELGGLFGAHFNIIESKIIEKEQVGGISVFNYFFMELNDEK
jgi:2-polyprenyl-3-methyl-5-hydroxy-6-metoxy-1,4-benzoquinol methylase